MLFHSHMVCPRALSWAPFFLPSILPLSNIIANFNVTHHLYADDTQIYLALDHRNFDSSFAELTECLTCVQNWMAGVKLKLIPEKTEFIIIGDRQARESFINKFPTQLLGNSISPTDTVKNLGVTFDSGNTFTSHITNMCCACYYHLKDLRRICKFLSVDTAALLANSMISSRLDYCNSPLYGVSKYNVNKLQKIQNALSRIVFRLDRTSHVTPFLQKLHWLPITYCILFKYNLITFKAIKLSQPIYLSSLIKTSCLARGNRLSLSSVSHKKAIGRRGLAMASPTEWNRLPQSVRSQQTITGFRSQLKTYLLCQLTCQSADIMSSLCGVGVRVRVNNFFSKTTRPRDMLFFVKDTWICLSFFLINFFNNF